MRDTRLSCGCGFCHGEGHTEEGIWDCQACDGTGIGDDVVRDACRTLVAAAMGIQVFDVQPSAVNRFWLALPVQGGTP